VTLRVCVDEHGNLTGVPSVAHAEGLLKDIPREKPDPPDVRGCATIRVKVVPDGRPVWPPAIPPLPSRFPHQEIAE
jgi:hypothetical protein